jgi:hypothetical protein
MDFKTIVAESPYDQMGEEFADLFGTFLDTYNLSDETVSFQDLALHIFKLRLSLAERHKTFFAKQVQLGIRQLWKERFCGVGNVPCYSFAMPQMARTAKFYGVCEKYHAAHNAETTVRIWDKDYATEPELPFGPHELLKKMPVFEHSYRPRFEARDGGSFFFRWMRFSNRVYLFEHPRSKWIHMLKNEAQAWWNMARDTKLTAIERYRALASFEWLWTIANPFMRAGATTGDVLSFLVQKEMRDQGMNVHIRQYFYAQDCEALILPYEEYVAKRVEDLSNGHKKMFDF